MPSPKVRSHELASTGLERHPTSPELKLIAEPRPKQSRSRSSRMTAASNSGSDGQNIGADSQVRGAIEND